MNHPKVALHVDHDDIAKASATVIPYEPHSTGFLVAVDIGRGFTIYARDDVTVAEFAAMFDGLAGKVREALAANAQTERLPGCDGSDLPAPVRQPRERPVQCWHCGKETWNLDATCSRCAERHCQHCADPVLSVEGGLIHTTNGTTFCDDPKADVVGSA